MQRCTWKTKFLRMSWKDFFRLLLTEFLTASTLAGHLVVNFLPDLGFSAFLLRLFTDSVTWNLYPTINLSFLGIIVKVKHPTKFCWHSFEWFCLQISSDANFFSCPRHCHWGLIVVTVYYFQIWNKKNTIFLFVEWLAITWVPCILKHPILLLIIMRRRRRRMIIIHMRKSGHG